MPDVRGKAVAMALLALTGGLGSLADITQGSPDEPHAPIEITGDVELRTNACACVSNPDADGTPSDPFIIEDWRIQTTGTAITIRNIDEEHFVVRDNSIEATRGIHLMQTGDRGVVVENTVNFRVNGITTESSATRVSDNTVQGVYKQWDERSIGIAAEGGSPTIDGNYVSLADKGILAKSSTPTIESNEVVAVDDGVRLLASAEARLEDNTIRLAERWGVHVSDSAHARLISNEIREGQGGVVADNAKLYMQDNKVMNQKADAIRFDRSAVTMFRNEIVNNWRGAFGSQNSDLLIKDNLFKDNGDEAGPNVNAGLRLDGSEGRVVNNTVVGNDIGIRLDHSIIALEDNNLSDNRWGMSIPYSSKGSIPLMSGNVVNGVNVDGTLDEDEQRIFYEQVNVTVSDQKIDSGHSEGYFGTLFKQGAVVVYDSQDVTIQDNEFKYNDVAIHIEDSAFVRIRGNFFISNNKAVITIDTNGTFIKENVCDIEVDPPETICFRAENGFTTVRANVVANVAVGIHFKSAATGEIIDNEIRSTVEAGLKLEANSDQSRQDVIVAENSIEANLVGAVLLNFHGTLESNTIGNSTEAAVHVNHRTDAKFVENKIVFNAEGVVDQRDCEDDYRLRCSTGVFIENEFKHNAGVGVHLEGIHHDDGEQKAPSFEGDVFVNNEVGADIEGAATMDGIEATGNAEVGVHVRGDLVIEDSNLSANGEHGLEATGEVRIEEVNASFNGENGLRLRGDADLEAVVASNNSKDGAHIQGRATIEEGNFSGNDETGLRLGGTLFIVEKCEASFNANGVVMTEGDVEVNIRVPTPNVPDITFPSLPDVPDSPDVPDDDDDGQDPLFMHECDIVANSDYALRANLEAAVNATLNFWGKKGPVMDAPLFRGDNVISANAIVSPYYETREHEHPCFLPSTELGVNNEQACVEP